MADKLKNIVAFLKKRLSVKPDCAIILGSGVDVISPRDYRIIKRIPYKNIPHFPKPTVSGHKGELIIAERNGINVIAFSGRLHYFEGYNPADVVLPVRIAGLLGARHLIVTNAAGAINPKYKPGDIMLITDHINLMWMNPLIGKHDNTLGPRFPDLCDCYSPELIDRAVRIGKKLGIKLQKGVYAAVSGPNFETPSEIRMFRKIGADAIGMSTVPEVITAVQMGMKVLSISCMVNKAAVLSGKPLKHTDVLSIMRRINGKLRLLITEILQSVNSPLIKGGRGL